MSYLKFAKGNNKVGKNVYTFSLPSGFTCPGALDCLSKADRITGKITDGPHTKFRCFSATQENNYKNTRLARWYNMDLIKDCIKNARSPKVADLDVADLIRSSLPKNANIVRIHVAGDFFSQIYFDAWIETARRNPNTIFYFYTKSLHFWVNRIKDVGTGFTVGKVNNFVPTASKGGRYDNLINEYKLRESIVVYSEKEAEDLELEIDHDDTHAMKHGKDFALLLHGTQPAGSEASVALQKLKKTFTGYGDGKKSLRVI